MTAITRHATTIASPRPIVDLALAPDWRQTAACRRADPNLFWPEADTPTERVQEAKAYCAVCPVRQACLDNAFATNEWDSIAGGLTGPERELSLNPTKVTNRWHARRLDNSDARKLAVQMGAEILRLLVKQQMSVDQVGERVAASPRAVYGAWRMLVPPPPGVERVLKPSSVENLLMYSEVLLLTLTRMERSHDSIAKSLGTSQTVVSAALSVIEQRDRGLSFVHRRDRDQALELCWAEETRIRREAGSGLTVDDVIGLAGVKILALHESGMTLRAVALKLRMNRESVRLAHGRLTSKRNDGGKLNQEQMGEAA